MVTGKRGRMPASDSSTSHYRANDFEPLRPEVAARWADFLLWPGKVYFPSHIGLVKEEVRVDYARLRLPYRPEFEQPAAVVHGGAISTLIDTAVVPAIGTAYDEFRPMFTIDMQIRFLAPVVKSDAIAEACIRKRGRSIVFCDVDVWDESATLCATATLTYKVGKPSPAPF